MKFKIIAINTFLFFGILTTFSFCKGQNIPENKSISKNQNRTVSLGDTVPEFSKIITVIFQDTKNNYWFSGGKGVYKYDGKNLVLFTKKDGLCSLDILGIQEDQLGNIYFDTSEGVSKFDGQKFKTLSITVAEWNNSKNGWEFDSNDLLFRIGFDNKGPYLYDGNILTQLEFPKTQQEEAFYAKYPNSSYSPYGIYSMYKDRKGNVWFGTASLGLCRYDGESVSWLYERHLTETPSGGDFGFRSIIEDKDGYFWFCNSRYRYKILPESSERNGTNYINYEREDGIGYSNEIGEIEFPYFMSMIEDNDGDLWMVTYDEGVWRNNGKELLHYPIKDGNTNVLLFSIYKDNHGILWLGTHNAGVYKLNGNAFERFSPSDTK